MQGICIHPFWNELAPIRINDLYTSAFTSAFETKVHLSLQHRTVTVGELAQLSGPQAGMLVSSVHDFLRDAAPSCQDPGTLSSRQFAAIATEAAVVFGIWSVIRPQQALAKIAHHAKTAGERRLARPPSQALVGSFIHCSFQLAGDHDQMHSWMIHGR